LLAISKLWFCHAFYWWDPSMY